MILNFKINKSTVKIINVCFEYGTSGKYKLNKVTNKLCV